MSNESRLLTSVHSVTQLLASSVNPDNALRHMLEAAVQVVNASGGSILLHDEQRKQLWFNLVLGGESQGAGLAAGFGLYGVAIKDDEGIAGQVFQTLKPHIENKTADNPQHAKRIDEEFDFETRNLITVPLIYPGGKPFGVMQLVNKKDGDFADEDLIVLDIVANISSMNIYNANLANEARRTKALDSLGRVIHDVASKVNQLSAPLEALLAAQDAALGELKAPATVKEDLHGRVSAISAGLRDLLRYTDFMAGTVEGQPITGKRVLGDLSATVEMQLALLDHIVADRDVKLNRDLPPSGSVVFPFDSFLLERAIYNLVNNALKATSAGGSITVKLYTEGDDAVLSVQDTGFGIQANVLARILSGGHGGPTASGAGLSTSIVREVAEAHGGVLEGDSVPGTGTTFRLRLPMHYEEA